MENIYEWNNFEINNRPNAGVWDLKLIFEGKEIVLKAVSFRGGDIVSWYNKWNNFDERFPNAQILKIRYSQ